MIFTTNYRLFSVFLWLSKQTDKNKKVLRQLYLRTLNVKSKTLKTISSDPGEARTLDPMIKSHLLYQLSYGVISFAGCGCKSNAFQKNNKTFSIKFYSKL